MKNKWRSFEDAREFARGLKLENSKEWHDYCKSGKKPKDIPTNLKAVYKKEWKGYGNWFGLGDKREKQFRSFFDSKQFVQSIGLKGHEEWLEYCKSSKKPKDIPSGPDKIYKKVWIGWRDFLGTVNPNIRNFRSFEDARKFVHALNIKSEKEWHDYCKSGKKPDDIPAGPYQYYKNEYKGIGDWLGTRSIATWLRKYRSFEDARKFVQSLGLKGQKEWKEYLKSGGKPDDIPSAPNITYKEEWKGIGDWLGTGNVHNKDKEYRSFIEARKFVQSLGLKNWGEWVEYCKSGQKPDDIPKTPWQVYKEWKGKRI